VHVTFSWNSAKKHGCHNRPESCRVINGLLRHLRQGRSAPAVLSRSRSHPP
jgi:hypothetical protein